MQMNPLLKELIEQYYGSLDMLPPDQVSFLQTVNNLLFSVSKDAEPSPPLKKTEQPEISGEDGEVYVSLLQEITGQLQTANQPREIFEILTGFLTYKFNFACTRLFVYNQEAKGLELVSIKVREGINKSKLPPDTDTIRKAAETRKTAVVTNLQGIPQSLTEDAFTDLSIPLVVWEDELVGVLNIQTQETIHADLRLFLEMLTTQTSLIYKASGSQSAAQETVREPAVSPDQTISTSWKAYRDVTSLKKAQFVYDQNLRTAVVQEEETVLDTDDLQIKPLEVQGELIGSFGINTGIDEPLSAEERALLESISQEVSQALERAHLFETSQRSAAELTVLNEMGNLFSEALNEETIVDGIHTYTTKLIEAPQFYVAFYDEETDLISFPKVVLDGKMVTKEHPAADNFKPRPSGTGLTGHIIQKKRPILIQEDAEQVLNELGLPFQQFGGQTQSWLGVPMTMGEQVLGVITVQCDTKPGLYNQHHLDLLSTIASQAAVALNNIRLFQQEQERAEQERLVRTITDKVRRGTSTKAIMQIAIEELSQVLDAEVSSIQLGTAEQLIEKSQTGALQNSPPQANGNQEPEDLPGSPTNHYEEEV